MPDQHGRTLRKRTVAAVAIDAGPQGGAATEESVTIGNGLYLLGRIGGSGVSFLVDTGSGVSILAARKWKEWGRTEDELTRYWGRLCSVEGRALECLGKARLTVTLGTRVVEWGFIVAEIGDDEGILGNDFAMAHELTVRPCEGAVYLPDHAETGRGHLGERLPCTVRVVTEVRTITEETLADNSAVSWLHRSKDPVGQPARWIEVIDTYDITFQHRPGRKHGNADALSRYPCRQCGWDCEAPVKTVRAVTRSQECEPGWTHEEMAARQDADPDIGPIMRWKRVGNDRPRWEDISPESRETKVLWRQWERLYLVRGVLHRQFHEL